MCLKGIGYGAVLMRIVITLDESLTVGAYIEGVSNPTPAQCTILRNLASVVSVLRNELTWDAERIEP
jgi:hypothetical protein